MHVYIHDSIFNSEDHMIIHGDLRDPEIMQSLNILLNSSILTNIKLISIAEPL